MWVAINQVRMPWRGSLKQFSIGASVPVIVIPLAFAVAAINEYLTILIFTSIITFIAYSYYYYKRKRQTRTRFFFIWILWSVVYMVLFFELAVPQLELLPEENLILVVLAFGGLSCLWRANTLASLNNVIPVNSETSDNVPVSDAEDNYKSLVEPTLQLTQTQCKNCHKSLFTEHCYICSSCVLKRHHHSYWLDCCIGEWNYKHYLFGLILAELALLVGINLTLTAICHPFLVARFGAAAILLPDDCTEVYEDYTLSVAFVIAMYAILIAALVFIVLIRQLFKVLRGESKICRSFPTGTVIRHTKRLLESEGHKRIQQ